MTGSNIRKVIISRTDAIGDVVLTLPLAALLKKKLGENTEIIFFGRTYTLPVIKSCDAIDHFLDYDEFSKLNGAQRIDFLKASGTDAILHVFPRKEIALAARNSGIPVRIGTTNRLYHWYSCNRLIRLSRRNSTLHEAQLNARLLKGLFRFEELKLPEIPALYHLTRLHPLPGEISRLLSPGKTKIIIHPKSHSSAREWSIENYTKLVHLLTGKNCQVIISGGEKEKEFIDEWVKSLPGNVLNFSGRLTLEELIALINNCDGMVACSTGPLHLAAALGKQATGIYPPIRPMDPGRWAPVGMHSSFLVSAKNCSACRNTPSSCSCINEITPEQVLKTILTPTL